MRIERNQLIDVYVGSPTPGAIECLSTIPWQAPVFEHQPAPAVLPSALMIEIMAQAGGFAHMLKHDFACMLYLARVMSAEFLAPARPGDQIAIHSEVRHWGDGFVVCDASVERPADGRVLATSQLMLKCEPFLSESMRSTFVATMSVCRERLVYPSC